MFDSVWFQVADMERASRFYASLLGRDPAYESAYWTSFDLGNGQLGLHGPSDPGATSPQGGWVLCLATDDLAEFVARAKGAGADVEDGYHQTPRGAIASFRDPDGNRLQAIKVGATVADLAKD
ncbi:MAG: VOC family protein [Fimbriimonadaceae bacterium]|nr:VOC family protein [Fimbriimonadaceae bacterium]